MDSSNHKIETFFDAYEKRFNDALTANTVDTEGQADAIRQSFIFKNNEHDFLKNPAKYSTSSVDFLIFTFRYEERRSNEF